MIPTIRQYKNWSLPSKYSFLGIVLALIPIGFALRDWVIAVPEYAVLAFNYGGSEMTIYGGAGDSIETAVIIRGANSGSAGVKAEYYWLRRRFPGYERISQAVFYNPEPGSNLPSMISEGSSNGKKSNMNNQVILKPRLYDVLIIKNWYGRTHEVYFDITTFIDKPSEEEVNNPGDVRVQ